MNSYAFSFCGADLLALGSGALFWPAERLLVVSDLHFGKSERMARRSRQLLPPYETRDTLERLDEAIAFCDPACVVCLGDSFDDLDAGHALPKAELMTLSRLMAGRKWVWIEGNHDPGPLDIGGTHRADLTIAALTFRHIAIDTARGEISGHYHPKTSVTVRGRRVTRPSFLISDTRLILPAFGTYTGGLRSNDPALSRLMGQNAYAIMTGPMPCAVPLPS